MNAWRAVSIALSGLLVVTALGCGADAASIASSPEKYSGKLVKLEGVVAQLDSVPSIVGQPAVTLYLLKDKSGKDKQGQIWVLRGKDSAIATVPDVNRSIKVSGIVERERKLKGKTYAPILVERDSRQTPMPDAPGAVHD